MAMDLPPLDLNVVRLRFADPQGPDSCAEVGLKLNNTPVGPAPSSTCRQGKGTIKIVEPYGWPPLAPPAP
jgi:hypothetical protein